MNRMLSNKKSIAIFLLPALVVFTVVVIVTVGASVWFSLLDWDGIGEASFIGLDNYKNILTDKIFLKSIRNSLVLLAANIGLQLPVAVFLALLISSGMRGEKIYRTIYFIPVIIMTAVTGQLWIKLYDPVNGLINQLLGVLGMETLQRNWLVDKKTVMMAVAIPGVWQWMGYHMLIVYSAVKSLPRDIYESAQIDGANIFQRIWYITLPCINYTAQYYSHDQGQRHLHGGGVYESI